MEAYITNSGIAGKLDWPVRWNGFDMVTFRAAACRVVNLFTGRTWVSGDFLAARTAEYVAASEFAARNGHRVQAESLGQRALILLDLIDNKPGWRE